LVRGPGGRWCRVSPTLGLSEIPHSIAMDDLFGKWGEEGCSALGSGRSEEFWINVGLYRRIAAYSRIISASPTKGIWSKTRSVKMWKISEGHYEWSGRVLVGCDRRAVHTCSRIISSFVLKSVIFLSPVRSLFTIMKYCFRSEKHHLLPVK